MLNFYFLTFARSVPAQIEIALPVLLLISEHTVCAASIDAKIFVELVTLITLQLYITFSTCAMTLHIFLQSSL